MDQASATAPQQKIDSKLRACDLVSLRVCDVQGNTVALRAMVLQRKTRRVVQFELTGQTRGSYLPSDQ